MNLSDTMTCPRTTIVEALPQCTEMDHQLDHHRGTSQGILQAEVLSEADQDHQAEEAKWALATLKCHTGQAITPETVPSEWTRSVTNHWKTCTAVPTIRLSETELSGPNEMSSTER